jgi:hypothetical protein
VTRDNGKNWSSITIPSSQLGDFALISTIHTSDFVKGKAYVAATRYMFGDRKPYLFKTNDYGRARFTTIFFEENNRLFTGAIFFTEQMDVENGPRLESIQEWQAARDGGSAG